MSVEFSIEIGGLLLDEPQLNDVGTVMERATLAAAEVVKGLWIQAAIRMNVKDTGGYIRGIESGPIEVLKRDVGDDFATIQVGIINTAAHAQIVEEGHPAFSLAQAVNWGNAEGRIKRSPKTGKPYLHIPFRHRAYSSPAAAESAGLTRSTMKAMMPSGIHRQARQLAETTRQNLGPIRMHGSGHAMPGVASGPFIQADRYNWGGRLNRSGTVPSAPYDVPGRYGLEHRGERHVGRNAKGEPLVNPAWTASKYHGMFRATEGRGGARHTSYMTIRTLTPDSMGWNIPAQIGRHVAQRVAYMVENGRLADTIRSQMVEAIGAAAGMKMGGQP